MTTTSSYHGGEPLTLLFRLDDPDQVEAWLGAADLDLGEDDIAEIELALDETGAGQA